MHTLQQEYAEKVYEKVKGFKESSLTNDLKRTQYGALAHKFPVLVRQAGLIQALAFVHTRGKEAHKLLLEDLGKIWLRLLLTNRRMSLSAGAGKPI
jgi:CRISPR-associated protein Cmr5